jgi:hypothetical protein
MLDEQLAETTTNQYKIKATTSEIPNNLMLREQTGIRLVSDSCQTGVMQISRWAECRKYHTTEVSWRQGVSSFMISAPTSWRSASNISLSRTEASDAENVSDMRQKGFQIAAGTTSHKTNIVCQRRCNMFVLQERTGLVSDRKTNVSCATCNVR